MRADNIRHYVVCKVVSTGRRVAGKVDKDIFQRWLRPFAAAGSAEETPEKREVGVVFILTSKGQEEQEGRKVGKRRKGRKGKKVKKSLLLFCRLVNGQCERAHNHRSRAYTLCNREY